MERSTAETPSAPSGVPAEKRPAGRRRARRSTRQRILVGLAGTLALLVALLVVNTVIVDRETKAAHADIGRILALAGGDSLQVREDGPTDVGPAAPSQAAGAAPAGARPSGSAAPTIVLLHGFDSSLHWWDSLTPMLAHRYRVIRFDLLGHGGSSKPSSGYSMEHQAQLIDEAVHRLGVREALVVGHSMGGLVATALATRDRPLIAGVVLIDSPSTPAAGHLPILARLGLLPVIGEAMRTLATDGAIASGLSGAFGPGFHVPHQFVEDYRRMTYTSYVDSHDESNRYLEQESLPRRLASLRLPALVIYGTRDQLVSPTSERSYVQIPGVKITAVKGAGHSPMVEQPGVTAAPILRFVSEARSRPSTLATTSSPRR